MTNKTVIKKWKNVPLWALMLAGVVVSMAVLSMIRLHFYQGGEGAAASFYHARLAEQGWSVYAAEKFDAVRLSVWRDGAYDGNLLYHALLQCAQRVNDRCGWDSAPFHFTSLWFAGLLMIAFGLAGAAFKVRELWLFIPLFALIDRGITAWMLTLGPGVWTMALTLTGMAMFARVERWRGALAAAVPGILLAWSTADFRWFALTVLCCAVGRVLSGEPQKGLKIFLAGAGGVLLGLLSHWQFPGSFEAIGLWRWQGSGEAAELGIHRLYAFKIVLVVFVFNFAMTGYYIRHFGARKFLDFEVVSLGMLSLLSFCAAACVPGAECYAAAFNLLLAGSIFSARLLPDPELKELKWVMCLLAALGVFALAAFGWRYGSAGRVRPPFKLAPALAQFGVAPGEMVANVEADDANLLYYAAPDRVMLYGPDADAAAEAAPEHYARIRRFLDTAWRPEAAEIFEIFPGKLIYTDYEPVAIKLKNAGCRLVYFSAPGRYWLYGPAEARN